MGKWVPLALIAAAPLLMAQSGYGYDPYWTAKYTTRVEQLKPMAGKQRKATVGDALVWTSAERQSEGVALSQDITIGGKSYPAHKQFFRVESSKPFKVCGVEPIGEPCLFDDDGDGDFDRYSWNDVAGGKPIVAAVSYEKTAVSLPLPAAGFERKIIYQGNTPAGVKLGYREFSDNLARDAFSEELEIQLGSKFPQQFAVKGLVLTVFEVSSLGMVYQIDSSDPEKGWPATRPVGTPSQ